MIRPNLIKTALILLLFTGYFNLFGQVNPVNNIKFYQWYDLGNDYCPIYNCFELIWQPPDAGMDTLIGYNIYKDYQFYTYTTDTVIECQGEVPCNYNDIYDNLPFWLTVKAVYNTDSSESIANDSLYVDSFWIFVEENNGSDFRLLKNPIALEENIVLEVPESSQDYNIKLLSAQGQLIESFEMKNFTGRKIQIPLTGLVKGVYFLNIQTNSRVTTKKIIIN